MAECMGLRFGLEDDNTVHKRKFRWLFQIVGICGTNEGVYGVRALPHRRAARPSLSWKEMECQHINETIWYPFKPDWKPVQLHLYDIKCKWNPVFDWIKSTSRLNKPGMYDPENGLWTPVVDAQLKRTANIIMLGGCGETLEEWTLEGCYPQNIEWGELDMDNTDLITVDITLRYDRAYITSQN